MDFRDIDPRLQDFIRFYESLTKDNLHRLSSIYSTDVFFEDPAHSIKGFDALLDYFKKLYANVIECRFVIEEACSHKDIAYLSWRMQLSHSKLAKGKLREIKGCSRIKFAKDKVCYQRDYFDLSEMLYQELPILGFVIRQIRKRLGQ